MLIPTIFSDYPVCVPNKGILHIGAHTCEEKPLYNSIGINDDDILWIEANSDLVPNNSHNIICAVISDKDDQLADFIITNNMQSSSILELHTHLYEHPSVQEIDRRKVSTISLNTLYDRHNISYDRYDFINLDIQGAELFALQGANKILPYIKSIYTEVNEKELYKGCGLIAELDAYLASQRFTRVQTVMLNYGWGDALYIRNDLL